MNAVMTRDPFRNMRAIEQTIQRLFEADAHEPAATADCSLRVDIFEDESYVILRADLPGLKREEVQIQVESGRLTLAGERRFTDLEKRDNYHRVERSYGSFSRTFQLPRSTDVEGIAAKLEEGVLEVTLPKKEAARPRTIEVKVH
uniref:Class I heat shock protein n=1 Tax=Magnetococcus massalia (strain MO-1) TaxID=451514 RepID=A0A1S7LEU6_MAGMO|nr:class I heat shock protein [Candidatus Magnetococcus massalia]